jgi:hypothetical protein
VQPCYLIASLEPKLVQRQLRRRLLTAMDASRFWLLAFPPLLYHVRTCVRGIASAAFSLTDSDLVPRINSDRTRIASSVCLRASSMTPTIARGRPPGLPLWPFLKPSCRIGGVALFEATSSCGISHRQPVSILI